MENKPNANKNSFRVNDQSKLASDGIIDNTSAPPKIFNIPTESQVTDRLDEIVTQDSNNNQTPQIEEHDLRDLTTAREQINNLKTEISALKKFILEQSYFVKKSVEDLKNQQEALENSSFF